MSLIINAIISTVKAAVREIPTVIKGGMKRVSEFLESDGAHDRRIRELNRRNWKCELKAMRGERRRGTPKERTLHPNQAQRNWAAEERAAREEAALAMVVSAVKNDGDWRTAFKAYVSLG